MRSKLLLIVTIVMFATGLHVSSVQAVSLSTLASADGSILQGDKAFSNFGFFPANPFGVGNVTPASYGGIDVQGITSSGEPGLRFSGPFTATFTPGGSLALTTFHLSFDVNVTDPTMLIHDVRHAYVVTHSGVGSQTRNVTVDTNVRSCPFVLCVNPGQFDSVGPSSSLLPIALHPSPTAVNSNVLLPSNVNFLRVDLDIFLQAGSLGETAAQSVSLPFIDVTFSQTAIPEPTTILLMASGLVGLGWARMRKRDRHAEHGPRS